MCGVALFQLFLCCFFQLRWQWQASGIGAAAQQQQQLQQETARAPQKFGKEQVVEEEEVSLQMKIGKVAKLKSPGPQGTHIS